MSVHDQLMLSSLVSVVKPVGQTAHGELCYGLRGLISTLRVELALSEDDELPTEFRIFRFGKNRTTKGTFTFDKAAARKVLASYEQHGAELCIDYNHGAVDDFPVDPARAGRAAGWFGLEVRGGELWAVNVRWTPPAAEALRNKEWRYMSPCFERDADGNVLELINVALTNTPATDNLRPLVAASIGGSVDPKIIAEAIDAIANGDANKALDLLKGLIASAAGGEPEPTEPPAEAADDEEEELADEPEDDETTEAASVAATSRLMRLTGQTTMAAAVHEVSSWRASHIALEGERAKLAKERKVLEASERRRLGADLVRGGWPPAMVWADPLAKTKSLSLILASMSLKDLRAEAKKAAKLGRRAASPTAPSGGGDGGSIRVVEALGKQVQLSALEVRQCGADEETIQRYAAIKARQGNLAPVTI